MDVWLWEMEMCCSMELEALRKKMTASLRTFDTLDDCNQWLKDEHNASREECARILKEQAR